MRIYAYGDRLQFSVFRCELSKQERVTIGVLLRNAIHHDEDRILFADLGPSASTRDSIEEMGKTSTTPERIALVF
jgi:CRISPR-associated protein Cas2